MCINSHVKFLNVRNNSFFIISASLILSFLPIIIYSSQIIKELPFRALYIIINLFILIYVSLVLNTKLFINYIKLIDNFTELSIFDHKNSLENALLSISFLVYVLYISLIFLSSSYDIDNLYLIGWSPLFLIFLSTFMNLNKHSIFIRDNSLLVSNRLIQLDSIVSASIEEESMKKVKFTLTLQDYTEINVYLSLKQGSILKKIISKYVNISPINFSK